MITPLIKRYLNALRPVEASRVMNTPMRGFGGGPGNEGANVVSRTCLIHTARVTTARRDEHGTIHAHSVARDFDALTREHGARVVCREIRSFLRARGQRTVQAERAQLERVLNRSAHGRTRQEPPEVPTSRNEDVEALIASIDAYAGQEMAGV